MLIGKTAIVTGASRGIGEAVAVELASRGVHIAAVCARSIEPARDLCRDLEKRYQIRAAAYVCDVSRSDQVRDTVMSIKEEFGAVHILVNNAGVTRDALAVAMTEEDYDLVLDTNLKGAFLMSRYCLPVFIRQREGCVVNISSVSGLRGNAGQASYAASKAGMIGMTKSLAREYASRGIRFNAVAPGYIQTQMTQGLEKEMADERIPLGRKGTPGEVAHAVAFMAEAQYITGAVLQVDGGYAM